MTDKELKEMSKEELIEGIYGIPRGHNWEYVNEMKKRLSEDPRYDEFVAVIPSEYIENESGTKIASILNYRFEGIVDFGDINSSDYIFSYNKKFNSDKNFLFMPRYEAEYNLDFKQLCVSAMVYEGTSLIFLKNSDNHRLANKITMIQGHVDYSKDIHTMTVMEYLERTILKEISEEIKLHNAKINNVTPRFIINDTKGDMISLEHWGVVFLVEIAPERENECYTVTSNEPDKHDVVWTTLDEIDMDSVDGWNKLAVNALKKNIEEHSTL